MKKLFFLAGCSALVLSSCSNEIDETGEIPLVNGKEQIRFNAYTPNMTRAVISDIQAKGFELLTSTETANATGEGYEFTPYTIGLANSTWCVASLSDDAKTWIAAPEENQLYWPENPTEEVTFYATYADGLNTSTSWFEGTVAWIFSGIDGTKDLLASRTYGTKAANSTNGVNISFNHILANLQVEIKAPDTYYTYKVTKVTYYGAEKGSYFFGTKDEGAPSDRLFAEWDDNEETSEPILKEFPIYNVPTGQTVTTTSATSIGSGIYVLPKDEMSKLVISYTRTAAGAEAGEQMPDAELSSVYLENSGSIYKYVITLPSEEAKQIKFNVRVTDWTSGTDETVGL